jgi:molecular chaperone DnaK
MSSHKIGLDFGAANSSVSYLENGELHLFEYESKNIQKQIPSSIVYDGDRKLIGDAARSKIIRDSNNTRGYGGFGKQLLFRGLDDLNSDRQQCDRINVTADFLHELLFSKAVDSSSFSQQKGNIESLVIPIPESYYRDITQEEQQERLRLEDLIVSKLGIEENHFQLISDSVAAATYWIWEKQLQKQDTHGNLLLCNMGSSSFNLSLCSISTTNKVKILYSESHKDAGFSFAHRCVQFAYEQKHQQILNEQSPEFVCLLKDFELKKVNSYEESNSRLNTYLEMPEAMAEYNLYCFGGGYAVKCRDISKAFVPIETGIHSVIQDFHIWMESHQQSFDFLFLVGDFCQFILTQNAILAALKIQKTDSPFDLNFNNIRSYFAISHGACLIANNLIDPVERCAYTVGIVAENLNANLERKKHFIPIIQTGSNKDDLLDARFIDKPLLTAFTENISTITVWVDTQLQEYIFKDIQLIDVQLPNYYRENYWRVGMRISESNILYLVIEDCKDKQRLDCELGFLENIISPIQK